MSYSEHNKQDLLINEEIHDIIYKRLNLEEMGVFMKTPIDIYSTKDYKKVEAVVQLMVDGKVTSYRVATETDISKMSLATLTKGTSKIKNITYQTAILLIDWSDQNHEKYGITID